MKKSQSRPAHAAPGAPGRAAPRAESKRVWRISDRAPLGEWVEPGAEESSPAPAAAWELPPAEAHGSWLESSMDLLRGVEVRHGDDTMPGELFGDFTPTQPQDDV